jgi:hypothetical protein
MRRSKGKRQVIILFSVALVVSQAWAQDTLRYVYRIHVASNPYSGKPIVQTGFRLKGTKGIITALHGVADGEGISASNDFGESFLKLWIFQVDVDNDVAILASDGLLKLEADGFAWTRAIEAGQSLRAIGNPLGIKTYDKSVIVGRPPLKKLNDLITPKSSEAFLERKSPLSTIDVINIEGTLMPGTSGAPLLDSKKRVLGVVDGGIIGVLEGGIIGADICWAIPIDKIKWKRVEDERQRLDELSRVDPRGLFAFTIGPQEQRCQLTFAGVTTREDFREMSFHVGVNLPVTLLGLDCRYGVEIGYLIRRFTTTYATLPGLGDASTEEARKKWFVSLYGAVVPFDWKWFNPTFGVLVGIPWNVQVLLKVRLIKLNRVTLSGEWRTMSYTFETYSVTFNRYGTSSTLPKSENPIQTGLGLSVGYDFDVPWEEGK